MKKSTEIIIDHTPVNDVFGKVCVSTNTGVKLFTALYSTAMYKNKKSIVAMAKKVLAGMIESGKLSDQLLKTNPQCKK